MDPKQNMQEDDDLSDYTDEEEEEEEEEEEPDFSPVELAQKFKEKGNEYYRTKRFSEAVKAYSNAIQHQPSVETYYLNRALSYFYLDDYRASLADCKTAIKLNPEYVKAYHRAGASLQQLGAFDEADTMFGEVLKRKPGDNQAKKALAHVKIARDLIKTAQKYLEAKNYTKVLHSIKEATKHASACPLCKEIKLQALVGQKHYSIAISFSTQLVRDKMCNNNVLLLRATCFYHQDKFDAALKHLQEVLRRDPDDRNSQQLYRKIKKLSKTKDRGNAAFKKGQWQTAIDEYTAALQIDPQLKKFNAKLYSNKAACLMKQRKFTEACQNCNAAIVNNGSYVKAFQRRGNCLLELGGEKNIEMAMKDYNRCKEILGENADTRELDRLIKKAQVLLKRATKKDFYKILGVGHSASKSQIHKAYLKKARVWHPDKFSTAPPAEKAKAEKMFKDINQAKQILSDPQKRRRYDAGDDDPDNPGGGGGHHGGIDPSQIFSMFMGGRGGGGFRRGGGGGFHFSGF